MVILSDVRKKLLALWLTFSAMLLLFFLLQVLNGKYAGMESAAWVWIFAQLFPGMALILAATLLQLNRGKPILRWVFWGVAGLSTLFLFFVLISLIGISGGSAGQSLREGFAGSYRYLLPMQGLLLAVFGVLFFKKESLFLPDERLLQGHAQLLLAKAADDGALDRQRALELFIAADMPAMLDFLDEKFREKNPDHRCLNDVVVLKSRIANLRRHSKIDKLSTEEIQKENNRIRATALRLAEDV